MCPPRPCPACSLRWREAEENDALKLTVVAAAQGGALPRAVAALDVRLRGGGVAYRLVVGPTDGEQGDAGGGGGGGAGGGAGGGGGRGWAGRGCFFSPGFG